MICVYPFAPSHLLILFSSLLNERMRGVLNTEQFAMTDAQ